MGNEFLPFIASDWICNSTHLVHIFQDRDFSPYGLATGHSPAAIIRHDLVTSSSTLFAPLVSSPCPDTTGGISHLVIGLLDWLTLWLPQTNQKWKGESIEV